jgi:hypothetical protein
MKNSEAGGIWVHFSPISFGRRNPMEQDISLQYIVFLTSPSLQYIGFPSSMLLNQWNVFEKQKMLWRF